MKKRLKNALLSAVLGTAILGALGMLIYIVAVPKTIGEFTEFYILGENGEATYDLERVKVGEEKYLIVGVVNREQQRVLYRIEVVTSGRRISEEVPLQLENNEEWEGILPFTPMVIGGNQKVELLLYKQGQNEPYRSLHLWIDIIE